MTPTHDERIVAQFSKQAATFTGVPGHHDAVQTLIEMTRATREDTVLDVACGPGMVACAFAARARHVTGIDLTPRMIEQARAAQAAAGLTNLSWRVGQAVPLPWEGASFSVVVTRYSFHHMPDPAAAWAEMIRVCQPGGRVLVADVAMDSRQVEAFDQMETLRDASHVHALTHQELEAIVTCPGVTDLRRSTYDVDVELESQLAASFPEPGAADQLRELIMADIGHNRLGINARRRAGSDTVVFSYPITVVAGTRRG